MNIWDRDLTNHSWAARPRAWRWLRRYAEYVPGLRLDIKSCELRFRVCLSPVNDEGVAVPSTAHGWGRLAEVRAGMFSSNRPPSRRCTVGDAPETCVCLRRRSDSRFREAPQVSCRLLCPLGTVSMRSQRKIKANNSTGDLHIPRRQYLDIVGSGFPATQQLYQ
jgi:hypothetical protein